MIKFVFSCVLILCLHTYATAQIREIIVKCPKNILSVSLSVSNQWETNSVTPSISKTDSFNVYKFYFDDENINDEVFLMTGKIPHSVYIPEGHLELETNEKGEIIHYSGDFASENQLSSPYMIFYLDPEKKSKVSCMEMKNHMDSVAPLIQKYYDNLKDSLDKRFIKYAKEQAYYQHYIQLLTKGSKDTTLQANDKYYDFLKHVEKPQNFNSAYASYLIFFLFDYLPKLGIIEPEAQIQYIQKNFTGIYQEYLWAFAIAGFPSSDAHWIKFYETYPDSKYTSMISKEQEVTDLRTKFKDFTYLDTTFQETSFEDIPKKKTVIHLWATFCKPCIQELPEVVELEKKYGDKINFIHISDDRQKENWVGFINRKQFQGLHLLNHKKVWFSDGIPAFFVLDENHEVISPPDKSLNLSQLKTFLENSN